MIHNNERLLLKLIEQYYGLIPASVAKVLINHGTITMKRALPYSILNKDDFIKGLRVLNRCDYASINKVKLIQFNYQNAIHILYYPFYLRAVGKHYGILAIPLLKTLFLYGHLSVNELIQRTLFHIIRIKSYETRSDDELRHFIDSLYDEYKNLFSEKIIMFTESRTSDGYDKELIFTSLKKSLDPNQSENFEESISTTFLKFNNEALSYRYFIEIFPYLLNPPFVNEEMNFAFKTLLEMTYNRAFAMKSTDLPFQYVLEKYQSQYPNVSMSKLQTSLIFFNHFFAPNFIRVGKQSCSLNFNVFLTSLVNIIVKEFIKKNYGENSVRIFGALLEEVCIFENNLLSLLKLDIKELHRNLYVLDQNCMINISFYSEANQSSISVRHAKKAFSVNLHDVVDCILKRCCYSIYTILHRRYIEINVHKDLIFRKKDIENYKKEIEERISNDERKTELIKSAHDIMSENDHKKSENLLAYDRKVDIVEYHIANYVFLLNTWKIFNDNKENREEC